MDRKATLRALVEGRGFTGTIQLLIFASAVVYLIESDRRHLALDAYATLFMVLEASFLVLFSIEYLLRLYIEPRKRDFIFSFYGIIDLLAIIPSVLVLPAFRMLRVFRFLRVFRLFKATRFILAVDQLGAALRQIYRELFALLILSVMLVYLAACGIHYFERDVQPEKFGSVLDSMWWAVVTLTTVGYGNAFPITQGGKVFTAVVTVIGVGLVAIPSGLLAAVLTQARVEGTQPQTDTGDVIRR